MRDVEIGQHLVEAEHRCVPHQTLKVLETFRV